MGGVATRKAKGMTIDEQIADVEAGIETIARRMVAKSRELADRDGYAEQDNLSPGDFGKAWSDYLGLDGLLCRLKWEREETNRLMRAA